MREVIEISPIPITRPWKVVGRAARGVPQIAGAGHDILNISDACRAARREWKEMAAPSPRGRRL
eukprot:1524908-Pyramimonas_sp.AAC.1